MKSVFLKRMAFVVIAALTMSLPAMAQKKGDMAVGANLLYGTTSVFSNPGIGAKFLYNVTDPIRLSGEFDYFLPKKIYGASISMWDFSAYGHYLFPVADKIVVYPEVGLGALGTPGTEVYGVKIKGATDFVISLGGGVDYALSQNLTLNAGLRYKTESGGWFNILVGIAYKF